MGSLFPAVLEILNLQKTNCFGPGCTTKKGQPVVTLFADDRAHLRALRPNAFAPYSYTRARATRQGIFHVDGHPLVFIRSGTGQSTARGALRSDSTDYRTTVHQLSQKPGTWRKSALRKTLPERVWTALDEAVRTDLKMALEALARCTDRWGFDHAVCALDTAVQQQQTSYGDIVMLATRRIDTGGARAEA